MRSFRDVSAPAVPIAEVTEAPVATLARFEHGRAPSGPLVFRGLVADWPLRRWEFPRMLATWPKRAVRAVRTAADGFTVHEFRLSPEDVVRRLEGGSGATPADWRIDALHEVPELALECPPPRVHRGPTDYQVFMGRDTVTRAHYHAFHHALICQVHGEKRVVVCPPDDSAFLYAHPISRPHFEVSRIDPALHDAEAFPKLGSAHPRETKLAPGDALFVPLCWWHAAFGLGATMSTSLFWRAHWRDQLRNARLRDLAGSALWNGWRRLRKPKR